jgi:hypothetical protein
MSKNSASVYAKARYDAVEKLILNHRSEYDEIFRAEKIKNGIKPHLSTAEKIRQLEQAIANLRAESNG